MAFEDLVQSFSDERLELLRLREGLLNHIDRFERRGADDRIPAKRPAEAPGAWYVHHRRLPGHAAKGQPASDRLAAHEDIGDRIPVLDRPEPPGPAHPGLHLVVHEDDPMGVTQFAEEREELLRRNNHPAFPLNRLGEDRGDAAGDLGLVDEPFDLLDTRLRAFRGWEPLRVSVRVRIVREEHLPHEGTEPFAVRLLLPREADVEERASVERGLEGEEPRPLRRRA